jgi:DNA-binding response OmpR family regulator
MSESILIIEDDTSILRGLQMNLELEGYRLLTACDGAAGLDLARSRRPDLIVLDLMLPKRDGFDVIRELRGTDLDTPILVLSARGEEADKLRGLSLGADDYITKPFSLPELLARIRVALRRQRRAAPKVEVHRFGDVVVDVVARKVEVRGREMDTTAREFDLLKYFVTHPGRALTRDLLLERVWGTEQRVSERTVDNFVARLRQKIEPHPEEPRYLETVRGVGYRFSTES